MKFSIYNVVYKDKNSKLFKFGVIVPADFIDLNKINEYADRLLKEENITAEVVSSADECDFCDMAITSEKINIDIIEKGYSIFKHWGFPELDAEIAVYDTYVKKEDNSGVYHFDILIKKNSFSIDEVISFGKTYLNNIGAKFQDFSVDECQFCYVAIPTKKILRTIDMQGHYILPLDDIPNKLPKDPTRTQMIHYLRATNKLYRFSNFGPKSIEDILEIINNENKKNLSS